MDTSRSESPWATRGRNCEIDMPAPEARTDNWSNGANNLDKPERLPEGYVRELVNLDPAKGGQLDSRADYEQVLDATNMRLAVAVADRIVYIDDAILGCYSISTDSYEPIGSVSPTGEVAGVEVNGQVYISSPYESIRTDGVAVKAWAIAAPAFDVEIISGSLPAGSYKIAISAAGSDNEESGTDPIIVRVAEGQGVRVSSADERVLRVYMSTSNGKTLYSQGPLVAGAMAINTVDDSTQHLTTSGLVPLPACSLLAAYHGVILGAFDKCVVFTSPMYQHLMDPVGGFFQYSVPPTVIAPTDGGVYVVADKTYFITGLDSDTPSQRKVLDIGGVAGSAVALPDGRAAWFTRYGQAIGDSAGAISLPNQKTYAPDIASIGAAGVLEHNGNSMVVTTMRGVAKPNNLGTGDFADLETDDGQ